MLCLSRNDSKGSSQAVRPYNRPALRLYKDRQHLSGEVRGLQCLSEVADPGDDGSFLPTDVARAVMTHVRCSVSTIGKSSGLRSRKLSVAPKLANFTRNLAFAETSNWHSLVGKVTSPRRSLRVGLQSSEALTASSLTIQNRAESPEPVCFHFR